MKRPSFPFVPRFRLRTLLVLITAFTIALGLIFREVNHAKWKMRAAAEIERMGGHVRFVIPRRKENKVTGVVNGYLRIFLGDDYFTEVSNVGLEPTRAKDLDLLLPFPEMNDLLLVGPTVTDDSLRRLGGLTQLQTLKLKSAILTGPGLESLAKLPNLNRVEFDVCPLSEESLKALTRVTEHSQLRSIYFENCLLTDADLEAMHGARSPVSLSIKNSKITEAGMLALHEANATWSIRYRDGGNNDYDKNYLPSIQEIPKTEKLAFRGPLTSRATLAVLKDAKNLKTLELDGCRLADGDLEYLRPLQNLESLSIRNIPITDEGLRALTGLTKLRELNLNHTKVEGTGAGALPPSVVGLNLVFSEVTEQGVATIAKRTSLERLFLGGPQITDAAVDDLAKMTSLRYLFLPETAIGAAGGDRLRQALPNCKIEFH